MEVLLEDISSRRVRVKGSRALSERYFYDCFIKPIKPGLSRENREQLKALRIVRATKSVQDIVSPLLFVSAVNAARYRDWGTVGRPGN
jgi:hypothetical protein